MEQYMDFMTFGDLTGVLSPYSYGADKVSKSSH